MKLQGGEQGDPPIELSESVFASGSKFGQTNLPHPTKSEDHVLIMCQQVGMKHRREHTLPTRLGVGYSMSNDDRYLDSSLPTMREFRSVLVCLDTWIAIRVGIRFGRDIVTGPSPPQGRGRLSGRCHTTEV